MSNINIRTEGPQGSQLQPPRDFFHSSPLRAWRDMLRWDPFSQMLPSEGDGEPGLFSPDFDVKETDGAFQFKADLPGMETKDVEVQLADNRLTISGQRSDKKEEKSETVYRCERSFGSFSRSFTLPSGVDETKISAELKNGVLDVTIPKKAEAKPKQVAVKGA